MASSHDKSVNDFCFIQKESSNLFPLKLKLKISLSLLKALSFPSRLLSLLYIFNVKVRGWFLFSVIVAFPYSRHLSLLCVFFFP